MSTITKFAQNPQSGAVKMEFQNQTTRQLLTHLTEMPESFHLRRLDEFLSLIDELRNRAAALAPRQFASIGRMVKQKRILAQQHRAKELKIRSDAQAPSTIERFGLSFQEALVATANENIAEVDRQLRRLADAARRWPAPQRTKSVDVASGVTKSESPSCEAQQPPVARHKRTRRIGRKYQDIASEAK